MSQILNHSIPPHPLSHTHTHTPPLFHNIPPSPLEPRIKDTKLINHMLNTEKSTGGQRNKASFIVKPFIHQLAQHYTLKRRTHILWFDIFFNY